MADPQDFSISELWCPRPEKNQFQRFTGLLERLVHRQGGEVWYRHWLQGYSDLYPSADYNYVMTA